MTAREIKKGAIVSCMLFVCLFPFLPKLIETLIFLLFVLGSAYYVWINSKFYINIYSSSPELVKLRKLFFWFIILSIFYFFISFFNIPKLWRINGLLFDWTYIPRHYLIVAESFFPVFFGHALYRINIFGQLKLLPLLASFVLILFGINALCVKGLLLVILVFISIKCNRKSLLLLAFFIHYEQSAYVLGYIVMTFLVFFEKPIANYLYTNTYKKIICIKLVAVVLLFAVMGVIMIYVENDPNSLWRLHVWMNEIESLAQTRFLGVGFGSAYVTDDIIYQVDNSNMYFDNADGAFEKGAFLVANHSSLLNMFYRMGVIGGILFFSMNIQLIRVVVKLYRHANNDKKALLWRLFAVWIYQTVVIFLNPGLEMMQFAISYLLCLSFLVAVILDIQLPLQVVPQKCE